MLHFTLSEDGRRASIDLCRGSGVRLSILRLCQELDCPIPPETLDEQADMSALRALHLDLLLARGERCLAQGRAVREQEAQARKAREQGLSAPLRAQIAGLRTQAEQYRTSAQYADDYSAYRQELATAAELEAQAEALLLSAPVKTAVPETLPCPQP